MVIRSLTIAVGIAAVACFGLATAHADVHGRTMQSSKPNHRLSAGDRVAKSSKSHTHRKQRVAKSTSKSHERSRAAVHRTTEENGPEPDANVQVVLPIDDENDTEQDGDHSATLLGAGVQGDNVTAQEPSPPDNIDN